MTGFNVLYERLLAAHGPQGWWPADDRFEIMVGSLLVQRTAWRNAELALEQLRRHRLLDPGALAAMGADSLGTLIRSAGFFRIKAQRLRLLAGFVVSAGGVSALRRWSSRRLRSALLQLDGIGPETADTILLYAFDRPVAIVDEYLRRLLRRLDPTGVSASDDELRDAILAEIDEVDRLNEFHALVVAHGKHSCRSHPDCAACCLRERCAHGKPAAQDLQPWASMRTPVTPRLARPRRYR